MLIFVRRKGRHNDTMEQANGKPGRHFTPQQKYDILKDIERCATIGSLRGFEDKNKDAHAGRI